MSMGRGMDKEAVVHIYNGILLAYKKKHIWVSSNEVYEQSEVNQKEKDKYHDITYMWNLIFLNDK